jgi:outer membrane murein-binding lipoprotein Lpp
LIFYISFSIFDTKYFKNVNVSILLLLYFKLPHHQTKTQGEQMKKIILSTVAVAAMTTMATASSEIQTLKDQINALYNKIDTMETKQAQAEEAASKEKKSTPLFSKLDSIKLSGLTYLGFTNTSFDNADSTNLYEIRRAYLQVQGYFSEDSKSYYRVTFDQDKDETGDEKVRAKYAYVYLDDVITNTGVEIGLAHRPWHDYEEHNAWMYRNISWVLIESKRDGDLSNSADYGVMFKTKTQYFEADYGLFSGEGYHGDENTNKLSFEWRTTAHLLGTNGKDAQTTTTYLDASFFGQLNPEHKNVDVNVSGTIHNEDQDLNFYGFHAVYNQPEFLLAGQYVKSDNTSDIAANYSSKSGKGWSVNGEYRFGDEYQYRLLGRYDNWEPEGKDAQKSWIAGLAWEQNSNLQWVANVIQSNEAATKSISKSTPKIEEKSTALMLTAEVHF